MIRCPLRREKHVASTPHVVELPSLLGNVRFLNVMFVGPEKQKTYVSKLFRFKVDVANLLKPDDISFNVSDAETGNYIDSPVNILNNGEGELDVSFIVPDVSLILVVEMEQWNNGKPILGPRLLVEVLDPSLEQNNEELCPEVEKPKPKLIYSGVSPHEAIINIESIITLNAYDLIETKELKVIINDPSTNYVIEPSLTFVDSNEIINIIFTSSMLLELLCQLIINDEVMLEIPIIVKSAPENTDELKEQRIEEPKGEFEIPNQPQITILSNNDVPMSDIATNAKKEPIQTKPNDSRRWRLFGVLILAVAIIFGFSNFLTVK